MRKSLLAFGAVGLVMAVAGLCRSDDAANARTIIDKAIKATGGEESLAKYKAATFKETGTYYGMGAGLPYTGKYAMQWPYQFRMEIEGIFTMVVNGDKGWAKEGGNTREMTKEELTEQRNQHYAGWLTTLLPLRDRAFVLTSVGEIKVGDRPALGVKVTRKGQPDVNLFFDKETGLLAKMQQRVKASEQGGKEVTQEVIYADRQDVNGIKMAMKIDIQRDGKQFVEATMQEFKITAKLDDNVFGKP